MTARWMSAGALATLMPLVASCAAPLRVTRYDPGQELEGRGTVYFLPKTLLTLSFSVELTAHPGESCAREVEGCEYTVPADGLRLVEAELTREVLPDDRAGFVLESQGTFVTGTDFTATFNEQGELLSTNSTVTDQTLETVLFGVETFGKLFSTAIMAGGSDLRAIQQKAARRDQLLKAIRLLNGQTGDALEEGDVDAVLDASKTLRTLETELAEAEEALTQVVTLPVSCTVDPAQVSLAAGVEGQVRVFDIDPARPATCPGYAWLQTWITRSGLRDAPALPTVRIHLNPQASVEPMRSPDDQWHALRAAAGPVGQSWVPGLVYRIPAWFEVTVLTSAGPLLHSTVPVPQLGRLAALTIDQSALRKDRTLEVSLFEGLGSIEEVHYSLSAMDLETAQQVVDAITNMEAQRADLETAQLEAQTAALQAQMEYLQAQAELEALKQELEEAAEATPTPTP